MNLTIQDILRIARKKELGISKLSPKLKVHDVSTDSRSVKKGDLFFALRGENFNGHDFIKTAQTRGAIAAIVDEKWWNSADRKKQALKLPLLVVKNTLDSYGELSNLYRKKFSIPVLLIAGSNGKTTMKEVISHVLGSSLYVVMTEANFNNQVGLPKMLYRMRREHEIAVLEIGTNHPGEIAWLTRVAEPTHGLITNLGREHLEFFKDVKGVAKEELALFDYLARKKGFVFINNDDAFLVKEKKRFNGRNITFGNKTKADVIASALGFTSDAQLKVRIHIGAKQFHCKSYLIADYAPSLIAGVTAVASYFGMTPVKIAKALSGYKPHSKRMEIVKLRGGATAINDSYNANPESFLAALETLKKIPVRGKRYVIAGDMFELGNTSEREHKLLGKVMAKYRFDGYFFTGKAMKDAFGELIKRNTKLHATYESNKNAIAESIRTLLKQGDVFLIKGSRGMKMETIIEQL